MNVDSAGNLTVLVQAAHAGNQPAAQQLFAAVYDQLRQLARQRMGGERAGHTLQATALVHEAYMRVTGGQDGPCAGRAEFFLAAAEAMRRILIDHARARACQKRSGSRKRLSLENVLDLAQEEKIDEILILDEALSRLEKISPSVVAVIRLRFFAGLDVDETAATLGVSPSTVKREWTFGRAWLARTLSGEDA